MKNYTQLNYEERVIIADLWKKSKKVNYISKYLKRSWETINTEIKRNGYLAKYQTIIYVPKTAQNKYLKRRKKSKKQFRFIENNFKIKEKIYSEIIENQLSADQISIRYQKEINNISHQTIYNWIYRIESKSEKKEIIKNLRRTGILNLWKMPIWMRSIPTDFSEYLEEK